MASEQDLAALEVQKAKVMALKKGDANGELPGAVTELKRLKALCGEVPLPKGKDKKKEPAAAPVKEGPSKKDLKKAAKKDSKQNGKPADTVVAAAAPAPALSKAASATAAPAATKALPSLRAGFDL